MEEKYYGVEEHLDEALAAGREPQYVDEAEVLLGPFFEDEALSRNLIFDGMKSVPREKLLARASLYGVALRVLATERYEARKEAQRQGTYPETTDYDQLLRRSDAFAWNEEWSDTLTKAVLSSMAYTRESRDAEHPKIDPKIQTARSMLDVVKQAEREEVALEKHVGLRPHQLPYMSSIMEFMDSQPRAVQVPGKEQVYTIKGATVEAPMGGGKTALIARTLVYARVGQPFGLNDDGTPRIKNAIIIVSGEDLADQFMGKLGRNTFQMMAPDLEVGAFYGGHKDTSKPVTIVSIDQYNKYFRNGALYGKPIDIQAIDEGHQLTQPIFQETFLEHGSHLPTLAFTATPAYSVDKDVKNILPYPINHADMLSYMEDGILNKAQIYIVLVKPQYSQEMLVEMEKTGQQLTPDQLEELDREAMEQTIIEFCKPLIEEGRRGIIVCRAGDEAKYAKLLSESFAALKRPDGEPIKVGCLHSYKSGEDDSNRKIRREYNEGKIDIMTTVATGLQGLDADIDFVGAAYNPSSELKLKQVFGRGTRLSRRFPITVYAQFISASQGAASRRVTFYDLFGMSEVEQGVILGQSKPASGRKSRLRKDAEYQGVPMSAFSGDIRHILQGAEGKVAGELHLTYDLGSVPPDYVGFSTIYAPVSDRLTALAAHNRLRKAGYKWISVIHSVAGQKQSVRYYEPTAATFFSDNPLPPVKADDELSNQQLAARLGVSEAHVTEILKPRLQHETNISLVRRLSRTGRVWSYFGPEAVEWAEKEVAKIPQAAATDMLGKDMVLQLGVNDAKVKKVADDLGIGAEYKRHHDRAGFGWYWTEAQCQLIKDNLEKYPQATPTDWSAPRIAAAAGVALTDAHKQLARVKDQAYKRRTETKRGVESIDHWDEETARMTIEAIKRHKAWLESLPQATEHDWPLTRIADAAFMSVKRLEGRLTEEDTQKLQLMRPAKDAKSKKVRNYMPEADAQALLTRLHKEAYLPPHLVPLPIALHLVDTATRDLPFNMRKRVETTKVELPKRTVSAISWNTLLELLNRYGARLGMPQIDFSRLPQGPDDTDPDKQLYARSIHLHFLSARDLAYPDGIID